MSLATNFRWALQETIRKIKKDFLSFSFAVSMASLALTIPLFIASVGYGLSEPLRGIPVAMELTIFTKSGAQIERVTKEIEKIPNVDSVRVISRDEAFKELSQSIGLSSFKGIKNPLPDIVIASLDKNLDRSGIDQAAEAISEIKGVDLVPFNPSWHEKLQALAKASNVAIILLGGLVAVLVLFVIATAIHLTTLSARHELRALHLFGASPAFACRSFAWTGFVLMGCASILALGLAQIGILILGGYVQQAGALYEVEITLSLPNSEWCASFVLIFCLIGALTASIAARRTWNRISHG